LNKKLIVVAGPTAIGKTAAAIQIAEYFKTEIISADSRQFFREMKIGTAPPSPEELKRVTHYLAGSHSITEEYNVAAFEAEALEILSKIFQSNDYAVMVGGSGLYIKAVCEGLDEVPGADDSVREELTWKYREYGISYLQEELYSRDPEHYKSMDIHNPRRLIRALEVCLTSGRPYSSFRKGAKKQREFETIRIGLDLPREDLYRNINKRVDKMMEEGLLEEARSLYPVRHLNALQTVGYKELFEYFDGKADLEDAVEKIKQNTRRYAKRQLTWFRRDPYIRWFQPGNTEEIIRYIKERSGEPGI
jgi:tRNA dimethylallyltransferase